MRGHAPCHIARKPNARASVAAEKVLCTSTKFSSDTSI
jgi:hypothetical protein